MEYTAEVSDSLLNIWYALYHLEEIFEDIHTLADFHAGEIQLESLKLLPGTDMRRRAEEPNFGKL